MEDLAKFSRVDDLLGEGDGRDTAVIIPYGIGHAGFLYRINHRQTFVGSAGEGLFAQHHLSCLCGGDGHFGVLIVGSADVNGINIVALDQLAPVSLMVFKPPLFSKGLGAVFSTATHGLEYRPMAQVREKVADALVTV